MKELLKIVVGGILFASSFLLPKSIIYDILLIITYILLSYPIWIDVIKNISKFKIFDEKFLMIIATIGAIIIKQYQEAIAVMLFYQLGEYLGEKAEENTKKEVTKLMDLKSEVSHLKKGDSLITIETEKIKVNDIIVVKPGEKIPLDGIIITGMSHLDTSSMTGESKLKEVTKNDVVISGCINKEGILEIKVTNDYHDSTVTKVIQLMEKMNESKTKEEKFITKFANYYTPIVVAIAILITIIPIFIQQPFTPWFYKSLIFLVISCPCALIVSVPLGFLSGIGAASKKGILIKNALTLENLDKIKTVIFDKTGTLTKGKFEVVNVIPNEKKEEILKLAATIESISNHPIALSIQAAYKKTISIKEMQDVKEITGKGIHGIYKNQTILVGSSALMEDYNIKYPKMTDIGTIVHVAYNQQYVGTIIIQDAIKTSSYHLVSKLKKIGVKKAIMLSGDQEAIVKDIGKKLNIDANYANLLPMDKVALVKTEQILNSVLFVGDGMNDAPVLMASDIGVSMGKLGSDVAIEASDIVIMNDDPSLIVTALKLSKNVKKIVKCNIIFSIAIKILIMILGIFDITSMWSAVFADVGITVLTVLNSLRIFKMKLDE